MDIVLRNKASRSIRQLLSLIEEIEQSENIKDDQLIGLKEDRESILSLLSMVETAKSKEEIREVWLMVDEMTHTFGECIGDEKGRDLAFSFDRVWQDILNLYSESNRTGKKI